MTQQVPLHGIRLRACTISLHAFAPRAYAPRAYAPRALAAACALAALAGCTGQMADTTGTAARAAPAYPAVHDGPAARDTRLLSPEERDRILDDLAAARKRQEAATIEPAPDADRPAR